jgi:hypothetical protein
MSDYKTKQITALYSCYILKDSERIDLILGLNTDKWELSLEELDEIAQEGLLSGTKWLTYTVTEYGKKTSAVLKAAFSGLKLSRKNIHKELGELSQIAEKNHKEKPTAGTLPYKFKVSGTSNNITTLQEMEQNIDAAFKQVNTFNSKANTIIGELQRAPNAKNKGSIGDMNGSVFDLVKSTLPSIKRVKDLEGVIGSKFISSNNKITSSILQTKAWGIEVVFDGTYLKVFNGNWRMLKAKDIKSVSKSDFKKHVKNVAKMRNSFDKLVSNTTKIVTLLKSKMLHAIDNLQESQKGTSKSVKAIDDIVYRCSYDLTLNIADAIEEYAGVLIKLSKLYEEE